jgi:CheY-like chemotaxis protein
MLSKRPSSPRNTPEHFLASDHAVSFRELAAAAAGVNDTQLEADIARSIENDRDDNKDDQLHVLVVEDNIINQKVLSKQLTKAGCVVSTADNGVHALEHLAKTSFCVTDGVLLSIILIDCEMPEMDGLTCCRKIREMEQRGKITKHVPVIAVTANIRGGQIDKAKESGMDDVIGKPFRVPDLLAKMQGLLKRLADG